MPEIHSSMINYNRPCSKQLWILVAIEILFKKLGKFCQGKEAYQIIKHESSLDAYSNAISGMQLASTFSVTNLGSDFLVLSWIFLEIDWLRNKPTPEYFWIKATLLKILLVYE